jgi:hypothetical protein
MTYFGKRTVTCGFYLIFSFSAIGESCSLAGDVPFMLPIIALTTEPSLYCQITKERIFPSPNHTGNKGAMIFKLLAFFIRISRKRYATEREIIQVWSYDLIDLKSLPLEYKNPDSMPFASTQFDADRIGVGPFILSPPLSKTLIKRTPLPLDESVAAIAAARLKTAVLVSGNALHVGKDPVNAPQVGDIKITCSVAPQPVPITFIARQSADHTLLPFESENGAVRSIIWKGTFTLDEVWGKEELRKDAALWFQHCFALAMMILSTRIFLGTKHAAKNRLTFIQQIHGAGP